MKYMLLMLLGLLFAAPALAPAFAQDAPVPSLCSPGEEVIFTCPMQQSGKLLSVCASPKFSWLQYRFGRPGKVELAYPKSKSGSVQAFSFWQFVQPNVTYVGLSFVNRNTRYEVFDEWGSGDGGHFMTQGVRVFQPSGKETQLLCGQPFISRLLDLEAVVPNRNWR